MKSHKDKILTIIESAVANLIKNEEIINELNVFPIPDGDTGSNMSSTFLSGWNNIDQELDSDLEIIEKFSKGTLLGARGNSGVISSQIVKGILEGLKKVKNFSYSSENFKEILKSIKTIAYSSVSKPVEGTILTVIKKIDEQFNRKLKTVEEMFENIYYIAEKSVKETKEEMEVLKESDVVDSGAYGLLKLIEGCLKALKGYPVKLQIKNNKEKEVFIKADPFKNIGYCTEFILTLKEPLNFNVEKFEKELEKMDGDSIVVIKEEDILKVHVHVKNPGKALEISQKYGEFSKIKSDNMTSQALEAATKKENNSYKILNKKKPKELLIISIANGIGIEDKMKTLGADFIIQGGQTLNPSFEDFIKIIEKQDNKNILILPNNSNIILTANLVKQKIKNKNIFVLPTKSIQQGILALYNINKEMINFQDFEEDIMEEIKSIKEGSISFAIKNTKIKNVSIIKDNYVSIFNKEIIFSSSDLIENLESIINKIKKDLEIVTLFYGKDVSKKHLEEIKVFFNKHMPKIELEIYFGGQSVYPLLIFGE